MHTTPACTWWNRPEEDNSSGKLESTHPSRTSVKSDQVFFGVESVMRVYADSLLIRAAATSTSGTLNDLTTDLIMANNVTSRGVSYQCNRCSGWVHAKCSGLLNAAQYQRSSDWACGPCLISPPTPSPPPTPTLPIDQKSDNSTFNVLQLNPNGIGNKLIEELGVVMENSQVKVVVIQE